MAAHERRAMLPRLTTVAALILHPIHVHGADTSQCIRRLCLPWDNTQDPPLCYTRTNESESFAPCEGDKGYCDACLTDLPCESFCSAQPLSKRGLGASCTYDWECAGGLFSRCMQRICRRALHTFQFCRASDPNDMCVFGQKSCFRSRCQGLKTGDHCWEGYPEGRDIDCTPGWYCYLGKCTPQLPKGHECSGFHPNECIRGYYCNVGAEAPKCIRQYTLNNGDPSSNPKLCKSNHVDPQTKTCGNIPPVLYIGDKPTILGKDCTHDEDCPRSDGSIGECRCKMWWEGGMALPGYCELAVLDAARPAFKQFWREKSARCHHDWDDDRCAFEIQQQDTLVQIRRELTASQSDPSRIQECARSVLAKEMEETAHTTPRAHGPRWLAWLGLLSLISA